MTLRDTCQRQYMHRGNAVTTGRAVIDHGSRSAYRAGRTEAPPDVPGLLIIRDGPILHRRARTARLLELKVTLKPANGTVVVYSPGYEEQQVQFSQELSFGWIPFAEPVLRIRSIGGPFEFNIDISPIEDED